MTLSERMVEAAARAYREAVDSLNSATDEQIAAAVIRRALAVAEEADQSAAPDNYVWREREIWAEGWNTAIATLAGRVTL
jgi:hypothetical protein